MFRLTLTVVSASSLVRTSSDDVEDGDAGGSCSSDAPGDAAASDVDGPRCGGRSLDFVQCWLALLTQGRRRTAPDRLVGLVRVPELLLRFVPGAPEVRRPVVHPATALRDPCTHHCSTHLVPAHAAASMHHSGSVGLASLITSHMDSAHGERDRQFLA